MTKYCVQKYRINSVFYGDYIIFIDISRNSDND